MTARARFLEKINRVVECEAQMLLLAQAERLLAGDNREGVLLCMHAVEYLRDRIGYEMNPPAHGAIVIRGVA